MLAKDFTVTNFSIYDKSREITFSFCWIFIFDFHKQSKKEKFFDPVHCAGRKTLSQHYETVPRNVLNKMSHNTYVLTVL